jgi:hypothetical protein
MNATPIFVRSTVQPNATGSISGLPSAAHPAIAVALVAGVTDFFLDRKVSKAVILAAIVGVFTYATFKLTKSYQ